MLILPHTRYMCNYFLFLFVFEHFAAQSTSSAWRGGGVCGAGETFSWGRSGYSFLGGAPRGRWHRQREHQQPASRGGETLPGHFWGGSGGSGAGGCETGKRWEEDGHDAAGFFVVVVVARLPLRLATRCGRSIKPLTPSHSALPPPPLSLS